jgi:hypothetical protein
MIAVDWKWTPAQILDSEARYPGMIEEVFLHAWQRALVEQQLHDEQGSDDLS